VAHAALTGVPHTWGVVAVYALFVLLLPMPVTVYALFVILLPMLCYCVCSVFFFSCSAALFCLYFFPFFFSCSVTSVAVLFLLVVSSIFLLKFNDTKKGTNLGVWNSNEE